MHMCSATGWHGDACLLQAKRVRVKFMEEQSELVRLRDVTAQCHVGFIDSIAIATAWAACIPKSCR